MKSIFKRKTATGILIAIFMSMGLVSCATSKYPLGAKEISIDQYKEYDSFGLSYDNDESECFTFIDEVLKDSEKELGHETKDLKVYLYKNIEQAKLDEIIASIESCKEVVEIGYAELIKGGDSEYMIHYNTEDGQTIMTSYSKGGIYNKTLDYTDKVVQIVTEANKNIRYAIETPKPKE